MPKSVRQDAESCLKNLIEALEAAKEEARVKAEEEAKSKAEEEAKLKVEKEEKEKDLPKVEEKCNGKQVETGEENRTDMMMMGEMWVQPEAEIC
ncbi:hypothetical protein EV2_024284 [Malus domestica]